MLYVVCDVVCCVSFIGVVVIVIITDDDQLNVNELNAFIYPNPNNGSFVLQLNDKQTVEIDVYSVLGKIVYSEKISSKRRHSINLKKMEKGMYTVRLKTSDKISFKQIIIQ